ncbi:hypothetical protein D3C73_873940 [compost metagenome]
MPTKVPAVIGPVVGPVGTRSAPCTSLVSTLPSRVRWFDVAVPALLSSIALGTSSVMLTSSEPVAVSPSLSLATTVKCSLRLFGPSPAEWASLPLRV